MKAGGIYMTNKSGNYLLVVVQSEKYVIATLLSQEPYLLNNVITCLRGTDDRVWYQLPYVNVHDYEDGKEPIAEICDYVIDSLKANPDFIKTAFMACKIATIKNQATNTSR